MKSIIIADDHPLTLKGMETFVKSLGYTIIETHTEGTKTLESILIKKPSIAIIDLNMPGLNGLEVLEQLNKENSTTKVIIYTMYHEKIFFEKAKKLGVSGYLLKDFALQEIETCLKMVIENKNWFSPKLQDTLLINKQNSLTKKILSLTASEKKILSLIAEDKSTKEIAELLFVSDKTIETHRSNIVKKLGLPNERNVLLRFALKNKFF